MGALLSYDDTKRNRRDVVPQLGDVLRPERHHAVLFENGRPGCTGAFAMVIAFFAFCFNYDYVIA